MIVFYYALCQMNSGDTLHGSYIQIHRSRLIFNFHFCFQSGGSIRSISWDHFFWSFNLYFSSLRQDIRPESPFQDPNRSTTVYNKGITPQELEGLIVVLKLIQTVAAWVKFNSLRLSLRGRESEVHFLIHILRLLFWSIFQFSFRWNFLSKKSKCIAMVISKS